MKKLLILATVLLTAAGANAQLLTSAAATDNSEKTVKPYSRLGAGYDIWNLSPKGGDGTSYDGFYVDWVIMGMPLSNTMPLYMEFGIRFNAEYYSNKNDYAKSNASFYTVGIPLNFTYRLPLGNSGLKLSPFVGLNFKVHASGTNKVTTKETKQSTIGQGTRFETTSTKEVDKTTEYNMFSKDDMGDGALKRFQMGWQIGANLDIKAFTISFSYGTDFVKIAEKTNTSNLTVGVGFNF